MAEKKTFGADMRITGLGLFTADDADESKRRIELGRLETDHFEGELGTFSFRADELSLDGLKATMGRGQTTAESADLSSFTAVSSDGNIEIAAHRIGFSRGLLLTQSEELFAPHASIEDAHIVVHDLRELFSKRSGQGAGASSSDRPADETPPDGTPAGAIDDADSSRRTRAASDSRGSRSDLSIPRADEDPEGMDWRFLDVLEGQLDLDLVLDMTLPWIGRRRATHYFRIPIENGTIDFDKLEDDVHWLEAAFLTIERVDDKLVLTRDLPLVPYSGKALLEFPLEIEDIPVAAYRRVHLRNLMRGRRPPRSSSKDGDRGKGKGKSRLTLHTLDMENIRLALHAKAPAQISLPGGAMLLVGDDEQHGLVDLEMTGALRHHRAGATEPTELSGAIGLIDLTVKDLALRSATFSADRVHIGAIDHIGIGFEGLRPCSLEVEASRLAVTNLRLHFGG